MTPLYDQLARASLAGRVTVQPELAEMGCTPSEFLRMVATSGTLYRIDEAEFDTTDARLKSPEHFETFAHFRLPEPLCWLEYKVYGKDGLPHGARSAFVAAGLPSGAVRVFNVSAYGAGAIVAHAFDTPSHLAANDRLRIGAEVHLATSSPLIHGPGAMTLANFFFELVEFLHLPGLNIEESPSGLASGNPIRTVSLDRTPRDEGDGLIYARPGRVQ